MIASLLLFLILNAHTLYATSINETFNDLSLIESNTAIVNTELGAVHPTLQVMNFKAGFSPREFSIGQGEHGPFELSTYANFSINQDLSGNIIRLDTDLYPILKVTRFQLDVGWTLEPIGSNPLIIESLTDVIIEGEIWCQGRDGSSAVNATKGLGGEGRCGGANGGDGGSPMQNGNSGLNINSDVTGGNLGNFTGGAAVGGGGGGSWNTTSNANNGANVNGGGGQAGLSLADPEFLNTFGGAGGGGGSSTATEAGGGGGGGGGTVIIYALRNFNLGTSPTSLTGFIRAHGGNGGSSNVQGGPGGGGGGGSVQVFVGSAIEIFNTVGTGASLVDGGIGGTNTLAVATADGGIGRHWFSSVSYNNTGTGFYTPAEQAPINPGNVEFSAATQNVITKSYDLQNTKAQILSLASIPVNSDFQILISGSTDNFIADITDWTSDLNLINNKRYIKLKIQLTTSDVNNPTFLESIDINYLKGNQNSFEFTSASCGRVNTKGNPYSSFLFLCLPFITLYLLSKKNKKFTLNFKIGNLN
jgi:hypothetical protein